MKKKILLLLILFSTVSSLFAVGAGVQIEVRNIGILYKSKPNFKNMDYDFLCTGTLKSDRYPFIFGIGLEAAGTNPYSAENISYLGIHVFCDSPFIFYQLINNCNLNAGTGITFDFMHDKNLVPNIGGGIRAFLGVNWLLKDSYMEVYAQQNIEPYVLWGINTEDINFILKFPIDIGIRWHY